MISHISHKDRVSPERICPQPTGGHASSPLGVTNKDLGPELVSAGQVIEGEFSRPAGEETSLSRGIKLRHQKIALCLVAGMGVKETSIACGVSAQTIYILQKQPLFTAYLDSIMARAEHNATSIYAQIQSLVPVALERMSKLLNSVDEKVSLSAAKDLLDRGGYNKVEKSISLTANTSFSPEDLNKFSEQIAMLKQKGLIAPAINPQQEVIPSTVHTLNAPGDSDGSEMSDEPIRYIQAQAI